MLITFLKYEMKANIYAWLLGKTEEEEEKHTYTSLRGREIIGGDVNGQSLKKYYLKLTRNCCVR